MPESQPNAGFDAASVIDDMNCEWSEGEPLAYWLTVPCLVERLGIDIDDRGAHAPQHRMLQRLDPFEICAGCYYDRRSIAIEAAHLIRKQQIDACVTVGRGHGQ